MDNLMISAVLTVIVLIIVVVMLSRQAANTDKKMRRMAKQFSLMQHNKKAKEFCKQIHEKYPELCAGFDFIVEAKGDDIEIKEWNSDLPQPDNLKKAEKAS